MHRSQKTGTFAQVGVFTPDVDAMPRGAIMQVTTASPPLMLLSHVTSDATVPLLAPVNELSGVAVDGYYMKRLGGSPLIADAPAPGLHRARIRAALEEPFGVQITGAVTVAAGPDITATSQALGTILGIPPVTASISSSFQVVTAAADDDLGTLDILVTFGTAGQKLFALTFGCDQIIARLNIS